jgi:non-specific serine/threonine protein kinase
MAEMSDDAASAGTHLEESLPLWRAVGDQHGAAQVLMSLGYLAVERGDTVVAQARLTESLEIFRALGHPMGLSTTLDGFACIAAARGEAERALRLDGAATALRDATGMRLPPSLCFTRTIERTVTPARQALGQAAAAAAWSAGRAMPLESAIAQALAHAPEPARDRRSDNPLTKREREIAALIARGLSNREVGRLLVITEGTAANHVEHILSKLGFQSRAQVAAWAVERGLPGSRSE